MGLFTKKDPCAICGGKVTGLFASKVEGQFVCKACYGNVDVSAEVSPLTMEQFKAYRQFREENQQLREQFQTTEHIDFGLFGADFVFDRAHRWFCLDPKLNRTIFEGSAIRSFSIREDGKPLFACGSDGFRRYESDVPEKVRALAPLISRYRMQLEMHRRMEEAEEERRRRDPDAPHRPVPSAPRIDLPEPFSKFCIEIVLDHPYWKTIKADKTGPVFSNFTPDANDYLNEYQSAAAEMERLAVALKEVAFPNAAETRISASGAVASQAAPAPSTDVPAEIMKYKALLDQGLITEEEFSAKKRQLLGI